MRWHSLKPEKVRRALHYPETATVDQNLHTCPVRKHNKAPARMHWHRLTPETVIRALHRPETASVECSVGASISW